MFGASTRSVVAAHASPFRAKGLAYRGVVRRLARRHGENAWADLCKDEDTRRFLSQPFLAASWYDIFPMVQLCEMGAQLEGKRNDEFCREYAVAQAEEDLNGVYRALLTIISPEQAMRGVIKITKRYFDFGTAEILELSPGRCVARRGAIPMEIFDWYQPVAVAYIEAVMRAAGAMGLQVTPSRGAEGRDRGYPVTDMLFSVRWT